MPTTRQHRSLTHRRHLALAGFRCQAAAIERTHLIRAAHQHGKIDVEELATVTGLPAKKVTELLARPGHHLARQLTALRVLWGVDDDPATSAAADVILAHALAAGELHTTLQQDTP